MLVRLLLLLFLVLLPAQALAQNSPPVITTTNNTFNVKENEFANFVTVATDSDGDQLTYTFTVTAGSVDLLFPGPLVSGQGQQVTNQFTVPPSTLSSTIEITVNVSDGIDSDQIVFLFMVTGVNTAPIVNILANQDGNSQGTLANPFQPGGILLQADITDPDGEGGFGFLWEVSPEFSSCGGANVFFQAEGPEPTVSIARVLSTTNFAITLTVLDGAHRISSQRIVVVEPAAGGCQSEGNSPPVIESAEASPNVVVPGGMVSLSASVTDPNPLDTLTFAWFVSDSSISKGMFFSNDRNTAFTAPSRPITLFFTLEVSDGVETVSSSVHVLVTASGGGGGGGGGSPPPGASSSAQSCSVCAGGNQAPRVDAGPATWTSEGGQTITLEGFGEDPDSGLPPGQVAFGATWSFVDSQGLNLSFGSPNSLETTLALPTVQEPVTVTLQLQLQDFSGCTCTDTMDLTIAEQQAPNDLPEPIASVDKTRAESGEVVTLDGSQSSDPDGDELLFFWNPDASNLVLVNLDSENSENSIVSFVAPSVTESTELKFNLTVNDQRGGAVSVQVVVSIDPIPPAIAFSQLALGAGFEVILFASNTTDEPWAGRAILGQGNDQEWEGSWSLNDTNLEGTSEFVINLGAQATKKYVLKGDSELRTGFLKIIGSESSSASDLLVAFFYNLLTGGTLDDSTGVAPSDSGRSFNFTVEKTELVDTGFAFVSSVETDPFEIRIILIDENGIRVQEKTIAYSGHEARLFSRVFDEIPNGFIGKVILESDQQLLIVVLRVEITATGVQLTSIPATLLDN